jgi:hypothetical protein
MKNKKDIKSSASPDSKDQRKSKKRSNTIILILIVGIISIILLGGCATFLFGSLNSARNKARTVVALSTAQELRPSINQCIEEGGVINQPSVGIGVCSGNKSVTTTWPELPLKHGYGTVSNPDNKNWSFDIMYDDENEVVRCINVECMELE